VDVPQVQAHLGHVDPRVTLKTYTHVAAEGLPKRRAGCHEGTING
jgi:integrase